MENHLQLYEERMKSLEASVRRLLEGQFVSAQDLWQIQCDLIKFQISLQNQIHDEELVQKELKAKIESIVLAKPSNWKSQNQEIYEQIEFIEKRIKVCKHVYGLARKFGDALAWLFLKSDEKLIASLTRNQPIGFVSDKHALTGILAIAELLSKAGAGFPVIHDMTNVLRIGDITFISSDDEPMTVEVKSHLKGQEGDILDLMVEVHTIAKNSDRWDRLHINTEVDSSNDERSSPEHLNNRTAFKAKPRLRRQLDRMTHAKIWQDAEPGKPIDIPGFKGFVENIDLNKESYHYDVVRELAAVAKKNGYANQVTNDGLLYVAIYLDDPTSYGWPFYLDMPDLPAKKSLLLALNAKSVMMSGHTWDYIGHDSHPYLRPFFCIIPSLWI